MSKKSESMIAKVLKATKLKNVAKLNQSILLEPYEQTVTHVPAINIALSGKIDGGIHYGFQQIAGPSKHFKSSFGLIMISAYLKQHDDAICLFYDGEFGTNMTYFENFGIDLDRVVHIPFMNIEELKFDLMGQLNELNRDDKVIIFIDSIGNAASKKEVDDALAEKSTADMSRAKQLASLGRMITPLLGTKRIPCIAINHTYKTQDLFSKDVVSGGCVVAGTKIIMADETLRNIEDVKVGEFVLSKDGPNEVTNIWNPETLINGTPECYEIEFEDGHKVICSDKHRFIVSGEWVEAQDLSAGLQVTCLTKYGVPKDETHTLKPGVFTNSVPGDDSKYDYTPLRSIKSIACVGTRSVYDISVANSESYALENGVITHNTKITYSSNTVWIVGREKVKEGGFIFNIKIEKSRFLEEGQKIPISVCDRGIGQWTGLDQMALEFGIVTSCKGPRNKNAIKYESKEHGPMIVTEDVVDFEEGEKLWMAVLKETNFKQMIEDKYTLRWTGVASKEILEDVD